MVNNHPDCDLQVRALEPAQGEAVYDPHLLPTVNDPLVCELQVRSPEAAQGKTVQTSPQPTTVRGQILVGETAGPPGTLTEPKIKPQENLYVLDGGVPGKDSGAETWGSNSNNMYRDYWYLESEEEDGSSPESDSDLDDYADDTDLNVSLDSEDGPDPDGSEADIKTILNMYNPTMLFAGRVTSRTNQQAATGSPPSTQTQQPLHLMQPLPPQQLAQLRRGSGARVGQYLPRLMLGMILLIGVAGSTAGG